jgi:hypothetical protein
MLNSYFGETQSSVADDSRDALRMYAERPELGSSISVLDNPSSLSLGPYVKLENDPRIFAISVFHGLEIPFQSDDPLPAFEIQQPSSRDYENDIDSFQYNL